MYAHQKWASSWDSGLVFGLISVLQPFNTFKVILGAVSYHNHTVPGQASKAVYQYLVHILSPVTDNFSSWISGRGRMAVKKFSWPRLHERICRTWGSNSGPLACQATTLPIEGLSYRARPCDSGTYHKGNQQKLRRALAVCTHEVMTYTKFWPKIRHLAPLDSWACTIKEWVYGWCNLMSWLRWFKFTERDNQKQNRIYLILQYWYPPLLDNTWKHFSSNFLYCQTL